MAGESGGNWRVPPGRGVEGTMGRDDSSGLVVVAGVMVGWRSGAASVLSRLQLTSHKIDSTLAANCWPWVQQFILLLLLTFMTIKGLSAIPEGLD